ncbi:MAG TPA: ABC transporter permease [Thermoanaerobaculia bacterium]
MRALLRDLRHALRRAIRDPALTAAAVLVLGLGIGAATLVFSMVDAVLLRPFPFRDPDRLVTVWGRIGDDPKPVEVAIQDYEGWKAYSRAFSGLAVVSTADADATLIHRGEPVHARVRLASANFFDVLGVQAALGRTFRPGDDRPGTHVVILSHRFWRRLGADPDIVGRKIDLGGPLDTVIGVMPPEVRFPQDPDVWTTLSILDPGSRRVRILEAVGRLAPGVTLEQARRDMLAVSRRIQREHPQANRGYVARVQPLLEEILGDARPALLLMLGAVGLLLLIACADVAGLLVARAAARQKEFALRTALGAGQMRLIRPFLAESLLLALLAAAVGLPLAEGGLHALAAAGPVDIPRLDEAVLDGRALAFSLTATLVAAALFGLVPSFLAVPPDPAAALREGGRSSAGVHAGRLRGLLVVGQVALALLVMVLAGLIGRSFLELRRTDLGFAPERLLTFRLDLSGEGTPRDWTRFFLDVRRRVAAVPEVESASLVLLRPLAGPIGWDYIVAAEGKEKDQVTVNYERVTPGYFRTLGIPLLRGRDFTGADKDGARPVAVVSRSAAERLWPGQDPIGKRLRWMYARDLPWMTVVGVVGDARYRAVEALREDVYVPFLQDPHWSMDVVLRTRSDPREVEAAVRAAVRKAAPELPMLEPTTMERAVADAIARPRLRTQVLGSFAALSLLLAAVGVYGILAYTVVQRRQEIGIRIALGAGRKDVIALVLRQGLGLTLAGLAAGLTGVAVLLASDRETGWLRGLLYQVEPADPWTLAAAPLALLAIALLASLLPALRALRLAPFTTLRAE